MFFAVWRRILDAWYLTTWRDDAVWGNEMVKVAAPSLRYVFSLYGLQGPLRTNEAGFSSCSEILGVPFDDHMKYPSVSKGRGAITATT